MLPNGTCRCRLIALACIGSGFCMHVWFVRTVHDTKIFERLSRASSWLTRVRGCVVQVGDSNDAWQSRECGLLALGCIADGVGIHITEHFGALLPYVIAQVQDRRVCTLGL